MAQKNCVCTVPVPQKSRIQLKNILNIDPKERRNCVLSDTVLDALLAILVANMGLAIHEMRSARTTNLFGAGPTK